MPGITFTYVSASQYDPAGDVFALPPQSGLTFTKEVQLTGSTTGSGSLPGYGTYPIWVCDAPTAVIAAYGKYVLSGSSTVQLVMAKNGSALQSTVLAVTSSLNFFGSTDTLQSATLNTGSTLCTQLQPGDTIGYRYGTVGNAPGVGVFTVVLQRF